MTRRVAWLLSIALSLSVLGLCSFVLARPGGGKTFGEPSASASAPNPYMIKTKKDKAPKEEPASEAWSQRPGYAAPWTAVSAAPSVKARGAGMPAPPKPASRGGVFAYFFWFVIAGCAATAALFAARMMKERAQRPWATSPTQAPTPSQATSPPDQPEQASEPEQGDEPTS